MSMPNIPNIKPEISLKRSEAINLLLSSIALEEIGISHIINAEAEKLQYAIAKHPSICELLQVNKSVERMIRSLIKKQMLLQFKLENISDIEARKERKGEDDDDMFDYEE